MFGGVRSALQMAATLIAVQAGVASAVSGGDLLVALWSIGVVGALLLVGSYWLMLPLEGLRRGVSLLAKRELLDGDATWIGGATLAFAGGIVTAVLWLRDEHTMREAGRALAAGDSLFFHLYGVGTLVVAAVIGLSAYRRWYGARYKQCPDCIGTVRREARRCRYCGYAFAAEPAAA